MWNKAIKFILILMIVNLLSPLTNASDSAKKCFFRSLAGSSLDRVSRATFISKLKTKEFVRRIRSNKKGNRKLANYINIGLRERLLTVDETKALIEQRFYRERGFSWDDLKNRVLGFEGDRSVRIDEIRNTLPQTSIDTDVIDMAAKMSLTQEELQALKRWIRSDSTPLETKYHLLFIEDARSAGKKRDIHLELGSRNDLLYKKFMAASKNTDSKSLLLYVEFTRSFFKRKQKKAIRALEAALIPGVKAPWGSKGIVKKFKKDKASIELFWKEEFDQATRLGKGKDDASKIATEKTSLFKKLKFGCRSRKLDVNYMMGFKRMLGVVAPAEIIGSSASYAIARRNNKLDTDYWLGMLASSIEGVVISAIRTKLGTSSGFLGATAVSYPMDTGLEVVNSLGKEALLGVKESEVQEKVNEILTPEKKVEFVKEIQNYIQKEWRYENLRKDPKTKVFISEFEKFLSSNGKIQDGLLDQEGAREVLSKAIARNLFEKKTGAFPRYIDEIFGDGTMEQLGVDTLGEVNFTATRLWDAQSVPRNIGVAIGTYYILCLGQMKPKKAVATAMTLWIAHRMGHKYAKEEFNRWMTRPGNE